MKSQLETDFRTALTHFRPITFVLTPVTGSVIMTISNVPVVARTQKPVNVSAAIDRAIVKARLPYYNTMTQWNKDGTHTLWFTRKRGT